MELPVNAVNRALRGKQQGVCRLGNKKSEEEILQGHRIYFVQKSSRILFALDRQKAQSDKAIASAHRVHELS